MVPPTPTPTSPPPTICTTCIRNFHKNPYPRCIRIPTSSVPFPKSCQECRGPRRACEAIPAHLHSDVDNIQLLATHFLQRYRTPETANSAGWSLESSVVPLITGKRLLKKDDSGQTIFPRGTPESYKALYETVIDLRRKLQPPQAEEANARKQQREEQRAREGSGMVNGAAVNPTPASNNNIRNQQSMPPKPSHTILPPSFQASGPAYIADQRERAIARSVASIRPGGNHPFPFIAPDYGQSKDDWGMPIGGFYKDRSSQFPRLGGLDSVRTAFSTSFASSGTDSDGDQVEGPIGEAYLTPYPQGQQAGRPSRAPVGSGSMQMPRQGNNVGVNNGQVQQRPLGGPQPSPQPPRPMQSELAKTALNYDRQRPTNSTRVESASGTLRQSTGTVISGTSNMTGRCTNQPGPRQQQPQPPNDKKYSS